MKNELLKYYPFIPSENIFIIGSPQFEPHFDEGLRKSREEFCRENDLDLQRKYICFSGDDITTCPDDHHYLNDIADAVQKLNEEGQNLGIIFRRSPVDLSGRYDKVLKKHSEIITDLAPVWKKAGKNWNAILPTKEDLELQVNTILHTEAVINLASSMVFDFAIFDKPCLYLNYEVEEKEDENWSPQKVYNFIHFRSMPSADAVTWLNSREEIKEKLKRVLEGKIETVEEAHEWFKKINLHPPHKASERIWDRIDGVVNNKLPRPSSSAWQ